MASKKRKTSFNSDWIQKYQWLKSVENDDSRAFCKWCKSVFSISNKGEGAVKEHAGGTKHKAMEKSSTAAQRFFTRK